MQPAKITLREAFRKNPTSGLCLDAGSRSPPDGVLLSGTGVCFAILAVWRTKKM